MASKKKTVKHHDNLVLNLKELIENVKSKQLAHFFINPVDEQKDEAPGYYAIIKNPMDISTMLVLFSPRETHLLE
jgi:Transcription factor involved in chromatin remodeling, contains bromodomain